MPEAAFDLVGPDDIAYRLELTPAQFKVTWTAVKAFLDACDHDQMDVADVARQVLHKLPDEHAPRGIEDSLSRPRSRQFRVCDHGISTDGHGVADRSRVAVMESAAALALLEVTALLERGEKEGCIELSRLDQVAQLLSLSDDEVEALEQQIADRGIELEDNCGRAPVEPTRYERTATSRPSRRTRCSSS